MEKVPRYTGKILVVDDEKVNVDFFQVMLSKLGFEVDIAYDGEEALGRLKISMPDLILLDLIMPKLSGFELTKILKEDDETKDIPIIILTAIDDIREKVDMLELGIEDYITKPFNFIEILARIRSILRSKRLKEEVRRQERTIRVTKQLEGRMEEFLADMKKYTQDLKAACKRKMEEQVEKIAGELTRGVKTFESDFNSFIAESDRMEKNKPGISSHKDGNSNR
jgi:DNA-binding response OmpR family regulator